MTFLSCYYTGNIKKKENFEWTFIIDNENIIKNDKVEYNYEKRPIHKERCPACGGEGKFIKTEKCYTCKGSGTTKNKEGKIVKCQYCDGSGKVSFTEFCKTCGGKGLIEYPKSKTPPISKEVIWTGWNVRVETNPPGAKIKVVNTKTGEYSDEGRSNIDVSWYQCSAKECPIIIEMNDKQIKVLPFDKDGKEIGKVVVDFSNQANPLVMEGQIVN